VTTTIGDKATGTGERSLGELVATATKDLSLLVQQEVALAKVEIKKEVAAAGKGAGMFGGAGLTGLFALIFLSISLAYAISWFGIGLGWGFFIVGMLYLVVAGVLALLGKKQISKVGPPAKTIATVKDDVAWAKHPTRP
jgi:Putative Actinobacterial Holin-X, holin superfamily III